MSLARNAFARSLRFYARPPSNHLGTALPGCVRGGSSGSDALPDALAAALEGEGQLSPEFLRPALDAARQLPRGSELATGLLGRVAKSLESAAPTLLRQGECVALALELPMIGGKTEPCLKALVLLLARRLRGQRGNHLPAAELPQLPALLQRLGLQDHALFDDFCCACAAGWTQLSQPQLQRLFCDAEDYSLLHPTQGPALARLATAIASSTALDPAVAPPPAVPFAALCSAVLAVRSRSLCEPLMERLRTSLPALVAALHEPALDGMATGSCIMEYQALGALELLPAIAKLHAVIEVPSSHLEVLLDSCRRQLESENVKAENSLADFAHSCGLCHWTAPAAADAAFKAFLGRLAVPPTAASIQACRHLPATLRQRLVGTLLPSDVAEVSSFFEQEGVEVWEHLAWLEIVHDLPALAAVRSLEGSSEAQSDLQVLLTTVEVAAARLLEDPQSSSSRTAVCVAYLATSSATHALATASLSGNTEQLDRLRALMALAMRRITDLLPRFSAKQIQALFRSPGEDAGMLAEALLDKLASIEEVPAQIALLLHASAASPNSTGVAAGYEVLQRRLSSLSMPKQLAAAEASLRRFPVHTAHQPLLLETLTQVRKRLFEAIVEADPAWCRTPPRGYARYIERCATKGRARALAAPGKDADDEDEEVVDELKAQAQIKTTSSSQETSDEPSPSTIGQKDGALVGEPESGAAGVIWHRGLESWEVRVDAHGYKMLGGYFKPKDDTPAALECALEAAIERQRFMVENPPGRRHTPY